MKVVLTGSNANLLSIELTTYLTGRYNEISLYPFSFIEYCRMPTKKEFQELIDNCNAKHIPYNGVYGLLFTSKKSGYTDKSIFLPEAGYGYLYSLVSGSGIYWSATYNGNNSAWNIWFDNGPEVEFATDGYFYGNSIRPVFEK